MSDADPIAAGVDGCRAGWVAALAVPGTRGDSFTTELRLLSPSAAIGSWLTGLEASAPTVAIDMPMGLPDRAGLRQCDRLARAELGPRRSSIFPAVDRELLSLDFAAARELVLARRRADPNGTHPVMTHQAINLSAKVGVLDSLLRPAPARQNWIVESHPELSFRELAASLHAPAPDSKRTALGRSQRAVLLTQALPDSVQRIAATGWPRSEVALDDMLDAYAVLWSALRHRTGGARRLGGDRDRYGLRRQVII